MNCWSSEELFIANVMLTDQKEKLRGRDNFRCFLLWYWRSGRFYKALTDPTKLYQRLNNATRVIKMIFHRKLSYLFNMAVYIWMIQEAKYVFRFRSWRDNSSRINHFMARKNWNVEFYGQIFILFIHIV